MTEDQSEQLISEFYGIDRAGRRVENVGIYSNGKMAHWSERRGYVFYVLKDADLRQEIERVFGWSDLVELSPATSNQQRQQILTELQAKARGDQGMAHEEAGVPLAPGVVAVT